MPYNSQLIQTRHLLATISAREHVMLCGRGAAGIWATLRALGCVNRRILIPANSCYIVLWAVLESGNLPLLVDVDPNTANLDAAALDSINASDVTAMIPCHMYGLPAPMQAIRSWANERGTFVIEDAALALGGQSGGKPTGTWGDAAVFSFGLGKIADNQVGGALVTDNARLAHEVRRVLETTPLWNDNLLDLTNQWHNLYWALHQYEDINPRLPALYPALFDIYRGLVAYQLDPSDWQDMPRLLTSVERDRQRRLKRATLYDQYLRGLPVRTLPRPEGSTLWRYPLLLPPEQRDELLAFLWENRVHSATRWYPSLRYMTAALAPHSPQPPTPNADLLGASIINLPVDSSINDDDVAKIARIIERYFEENAR